MDNIYKKLYMMGHNKIPTAKDIIDDGTLPECLPFKLYPLSYEEIWSMEKVDDIILGYQKELHLISSRILKLESTKSLIKLFIDERLRVSKEKFDAKHKMINH